MAFRKADIDKLEAGEPLRRQIIQNCNSLILQRQNDHKDAEELSKLCGTRESQEYTSQEMQGGETGAGSWRMTQQFKVHPDYIKTLKTGQAYVKINDEIFKTAIRPEVIYD